MRRRFSFKPRLLPTAAAVLGILLTAGAGNWQLNRAAEKARLQQRIEQADQQPPIHLGAAQVNPADVVYFHVEASGEFKPDGTVYVDNRVRDGVPGYEVVTPLHIDGGAYVLVNRGWVRADVSRSRLPAVPLPQAPVTVEGIALPGNPRLFELSSDVQAGRVWQNVTVERYRKAFGLDLQPIVIEQQNHAERRLAARVEAAGRWHRSPPRLRTAVVLLVFCHHRFLCGPACQTSSPYAAAVLA